MAGKSGRGRLSREAIYKRFADAIAELGNYGGLPKSYEAHALWDDLWHLEAHHSTAIEGNTLVLREVERLLDEQRAVGAKTLKDYMEVLGYGNAARWVYQQATEPEQWQHDELITVQEIRHVHHLAMKDVWAVAPHPDASEAESPGNWRQHEIYQFAGGMKPVTFPLVASEISSWVQRVNRLRVQFESGDITLEQIPEELAVVHCAFERIHPFLDGNGRTGRLLLNLILIRMGWPPAIILKDQRKKYLKALDKTDKGDAGPLAELISRSVVDNLHRLIPNIAGPAKFVPLEALAGEDFTLSALRQAASRGRLEAIMGSDGRYRSSKAALAEYKNSRYGASKD